MGPDGDVKASLAHGSDSTHVLDYLANFIENSLDAIVVSNLRGQIVFWNLSAERTFGWVKREALGKSTADLFWPVYTVDEQEQQKQRLLKLERGEIVQGERIMQSKDGSLFWAKYSIQGIIEQGHGVSGYVAVYRDITERKRVEEQRDRSNQRLNQILESIQDDFYVLDRDWKFVYANRQFTSKIEKEPEDFVGNNIWEMFPKHVGGVLYENFHAAMEKRQVRRFEIPGRYTDAWYRMTAFPSEEGITVLGTDITERKKAVDALKESQRKYQDLIETTSDFIWEMDAQGRYTYCSPQMEKLWGIKPEDMLGKTPFDIMPLEEKEKAQQYFRQVANSAVPFTGLTTTAFNGWRQLISIETSGVPFFDPDGGLLGFRGITRDVTERQRVEEQLRELSQRLTYHVDNSPLAVIEWGPDMRLIRWSGAAERIFGWKAEEVLGKRIEDFRWVYDEDVQKVNDVSTDLKTGTDSHRFSANRNYRKDGSVAYCEWYNSSLLDGSGNLRSILSLVLDVTKRTRAEHELAESEERYRHLVKYAPTGIYEIDIKTMRFVEVNDIMCEILGYTREELLSMMPAELLDEEGRERFRERMLRSLAGEKVSEQTEYKVRARDGREIWAVLNTTINYEDGQAKTVSVIAHDITERKRAEEALRAKTEEIDALLQVSPIAIFVSYDPECRRITANPAGYRLVGLPVNGNQNISMSAPKHEQPTYRVFKNGVELANEDLPMQMAARLGKEVLEQSLELRFEDGSSKFIYSYARPLMDENGKPRGAIGAMLDITEGKRMEHEIESMARFPLENPSPVLRIYRDGVIAFANPASNDLMQLWNRAVGEHVPEAEHALILQALELQKVIEQEVDCKGRIYSLILTPIANSGYVNIYGRDISERKRAEEQLRYQSTLLSNVNDAIVATDAQYCLTAWNSGAEALYGWKAEEVIGRNGLEIIQTEWPEQDAVEMRRTIAEVGHWRGEATQARRDGSRFPVEISSIVLHDEHGQITGYVSVNRDITARVQSEAALRESQEQLKLLNDTLAQKVDEQTAEMRILTSNLTKAEQRERHRIAHILHEDLQQRLYAIKMQLAFLMDRPKHVDPAIVAELDETNKQLDRILSLTRNLSVELSPPILHDEGLTQALEWLASMVREQHGLRIEVHAEDPFVIFDKAIQVLLFNSVRELLFNVVKHAGVNRAVVTLQRSGDQLCIEVRDAGKGFDVAVLREERKDEEGKSSFGLPTLRHRLGLMGGKMDIQSEPNAGTCITITIPYS